MNNVKNDALMNNLSEEIQRLKDYLLNDLFSLKITCITAFGNCVRNATTVPNYSDVDIVAYSDMVSYENIDLILRTIYGSYKDFCDKPPRFITDSIAPRIEWFMRINDVKFDLNLMPTYLPGYERMMVDPVHDTVDIIIGAMYLNAITLHGEIPFRQLVESEMIPFYNDELRLNRMKILGGRIDEQLSIIEGIQDGDGENVLYYTFKTQAYVTKWIFIACRKYPLDAQRHLGTQLAGLECMSSEEIESIMLKNGENIKAIVWNFIKGTREVMIRLGRPSEVEE
ncbi:hypothetical protein [Methanomassiliicoccus luminyensis]|uniref:hypothetical protein n=1 Tax=Methanomassiliicoccus luminyensis TaxID=1080712 RepID=UPI0003806C2A|nr:hypothetical protein [Methanomassiliicoccus luminyensis]